MNIKRDFFRNLKHRRGIIFFSFSMMSFPDNSYELVPEPVQRYQVVKYRYFKSKNGDDLSIKIYYFERQVIG